MAQGQPSAPLAAITRPIKTAIAARVVALFNDPARNSGRNSGGGPGGGERSGRGEGSGRGERLVKRAPDGFFGPRAVARRVHGDVTCMMVGGIAGLLLQMLHPAALAGVWDHSNFRTDMHGRLRRTARFMAVTTFCGRADAEAMIARVRGIHDHVRGFLADGTPYAANDLALLAWVHLAGASCF